MMTIRKLGHRAAHAALALSALATTGVALAFGDKSVTDLPGGPRVLGIDFQPAVTEIAREQKELHYWMLIVCTIIFVVVFGFMFYSIIKHRKSVGHKAANFHESTAVEIAWTVVPFIIVILMGAFATRTVVAMKDTTGADLTIKATGYQWKWGYDYVKGEGEGLAFISTLDTSQRNLSEEGQPAGGAGRQEGAHHHPRRRRDPLVERAGVRRQAGRDPRLRARHLVPGRQGRHLLRHVLGAVRQGARVHADPRGRAVRRRLHRLGRQAEEGAGRRGRRSEEGLGHGAADGPRREGLPGQLRRLPQAGRHGRRPGQAAGQVAHGARSRQERADPHRAARPP